MPKTIGLLFFSLLLMHPGYSQSELDQRNGFKDIKLGSIVDSVKGVKFKKEFTEENGAPAKLYEVEHPDYANIGEVKVNKIELKAYKDFIYEITVITEKDPRLMKAMESVLGQAKYNAKDEFYFWTGENLNLTFDSFSKKELKLVYKSFPVQKLMKKDKEKKVEDISNDF